MMKASLPLILLHLLALLLGFTCLFGDNPSVTSLFSLGMDMSLDEDPVNDLDLLWQPEVFGAVGSEDGLLLRGTFSTQSRLRFLWDEMITGPELYRLWGGLSYGSADLKAGLMKLNFGTARVLRPEQWFDAIDPLDPREETAGVKAAVFTAYTPSGYGLWLWGLLTKSEQSIMENSGFSDEDHNLGGRLELPLLGLETGLALNMKGFDSGTGSRCTRIGADLRWDGFLGLWIEASGTEDNAMLLGKKYQSSMTIGTDYTFDIGNGLYLMQETNLSHSSPDQIGALHPAGTKTAVLLGYHPGLLDNLQFMTTTDYDKTLSMTLLWQRTYDYWSWDMGISKTFMDGVASPLNLSLKLSYNI